MASRDFLFGLFCNFPFLDILLIQNDFIHFFSIFCVHIVHYFVSISVMCLCTEMRKLNPEVIQTRTSPLSDSVDTSFLHNFFSSFRVNLPLYY